VNETRTFRRFVVNQERVWAENAKIDAALKVTLSILPLTVQFVKADAVTKRGRTQRLEKPWVVSTKNSLVITDSTKKVTVGKLLLSASKSLAEAFWPRDRRVYITCSASGNYKCDFNDKRIEIVKGSYLK
jgi:hypothetical protein